MKTSVSDMFGKELSNAMFDAGVVGTQASKAKKDFELKENERHNYEPFKYLKKQSSIQDILSLVRNKKMSINNIRKEIKKHLKNPEDINDFLKSLISKDDKKETKEATASGGGVGSYEAPLFGKLKEEKLKGGKADNKTFSDLVKKYKNKTTQELKTEYNKGLKVEMEHTDNKTEAREIALDHLFEDPNYYSKLKKIETKEATSTSSSGSYEGPSIWAKTTSRKHWKPSRKTQIPGGKFVQVKKKCKRFPYCNQGDIKALNIFENETLKLAISEVSKKYGLNQKYIQKIIMNELETISK